MTLRFFKESGMGGHKYLLSIYIYLRTLIKIFENSLLL